MYRKSSINPPRPPPQGGLISVKHVRGGGGLNREGGLFNLAKTILSVLHKN